MKNYLRFGFFLAVAGVLGGCYQLKVKNDVPAGSSFERRENLFAFGFYGEPEVDLKKDCPHGVASFADKFTAADIALSVASVGIYTPRTIVVECAAKPRA